MNIELLEQKRKDVTKILGNMNESLMEQVPAKRKIKEIEFKK